MMDPKDLIDWLSIDWTSLSPERNAERKAAAELLHRQTVRIAELERDLEDLREELANRIKQRDQARRAYCLEAGIYVGDEDECRRLEPSELAREKRWPWPIADPEKEPTT
jgi:hypothetical protein